MENLRKELATEMVNDFNNIDWDDDEAFYSKLNEYIEKEQKIENAETQLIRMIFGM